MTDEDVHTHTDTFLFLPLHFIIYASTDLPQLSLMVSPVCGAHPWVFRPLARELVNAVSHGSGRPQLLFHM